MNLHEYQARILKKHNVAIQEGIDDNVDDALKQPTQKCRNRN